MVLPEPAPLRILYQDDHGLIAVDKPPGQLVHPSDTPQPDDVVTMKVLRDQIGEKVHVLHRLDRPTSGVLLFGLNQAISRRVRRAFEKRRVQKTYHALVFGHPEFDSWTNTTPLRKNPSDPEKAAETSFSVLERHANGSALIEARPATGRYHQIRRHLLLGGHPIVGDYRYADRGKNDAAGGLLGTGTRMHLTAHALSLVHPVTNEQITITRT